MTPEEAKTKWCPMLAAHGGNDDTPCIAAQCMAWRWSRAKETKAYLDAVQAHMQANGVGFNKATEAVWKERGSTFEQTEGYCGAFGRPE